MFISTSRLLLLTFFPVQGFAQLKMVFFSIKNENTLAKQVSSNESSTINIGNSVASFSESDSQIFHFVFHLYLLHVLFFFCFLFFAGPLHNHPPKSQTFVGNLLSKKIHSPGLRQGIHSASRLMWDFEKSANCKLSVTKTECFSISVIDSHSRQLLAPFR